MNPAVAEFRSLVEHYSPFLLSHSSSMEVGFDDELADIASTSQNVQRSVSCFTIGPLYAEQSVRDRRQTVIHELLHVAQCDLLGLVHAGSKQIDRKDVDLFSALIVRSVEVFTDDLAERLVDVLPKPRRLTA